jgi:hypothetical protein
LLVPAQIVEFEVTEIGAVATVTVTVPMDWQPVRLEAVTVYVVVVVGDATT